MRTANFKLWGGIITSILIFSFLLIHPASAFVMETTNPDLPFETASTTDPLPNLDGLQLIESGEDTTSTTDSNITFNLEDNTGFTTTTIITVTASTTTDNGTETIEVPSSTIDMSSSTSTTASTTTENNTQGSGAALTAGPTLVDQSTIQITVEKILNFFKNQQDETGKIVDGPTSEWAAMSFGANNNYSKDIIKGDEALLDYLKSYDLTAESELNYCASYPRHALALMAGGFSPTQQSIKDLNDKIKSLCVKEDQFGLRGTNDDIFGLFSLLAGGETNNEAVDIILTTILADQQIDGSFTWDGWSGADITGASINALKYAESKGKIVDPNVYTKAKSYLKSNQLADGGWGFGTSDALTTGWAMMGVNALGGGQADWFNTDGKNPWSTMAGLLTNGTNNDGYYTSPYSPDGIDWFGTKHAVPALLGKTWPIILTDNSLTETVPVPVVGGGGGTQYNPILETPITTTTPTTTLDILIPTSTPTTTPEIATTTPAINLTEVNTTTPNITPAPINYVSKPKKITTQPKKTTTISPTEVLGEKITTSTIPETTTTGEQTTNNEELTQSYTYRDWIKNIFFASIVVLIAIGLYITIRFRDKNNDK